MPNDAGSPAPSAILGADFSIGRPSPAALKTHGVRFVCRYVSSPGGIDKDLSPVEARRYRDAGIAVVLNWEDGERSMEGGFPVGVKAAAQIERMVEACDGDPRAPAYLSYDSDPRQRDNSDVLRCLEGAASHLGVQRTGIYGGRRIVQQAFDRGLVAWAWQTVAWSGGVWEPRAQIRQVGFNWFIDGVNCDKDIAVAARYGQWFPTLNLGAVELAGRAGGVGPVGRAGPVGADGRHGGVGGDTLVLSILQCADADAAFLAYTAGGVAAQVEWADRDALARFTAAGVPVRPVTVARLRDCTLLGPLPEADTKHAWTAADFRRTIPAVSTL